MDDSPDLRRELVYQFTRAGWIAHGAADLCEARMLLDLRPDVLLTDRRLPDGDGASLIGCGAPVVIYSGDDTWVRGASAVVLKPCAGGMAGVVRLVAESLEGAEASW